MERINAYSAIIDGYLIQCPTTETELFKIGNEYNNCLPIYRDRIIDDGAVIYSIYKLDDEGNKIEDVPSVTFEVTWNFDFIQIKTFNDQDVCDPDILELLKKWQKTARKKKGEYENGKAAYAHNELG